MSETSIQDSGIALPFRAFDCVVQDFLVLKEKMAQQMVENAHAVLGAWVKAKEGRAEVNKRYGLDFNPLAFIPIKEPIHSKIIGDFLDRQGSHGQGSLFLRLFLEMLEIPEPEQGIWQISIETGRVDILLWRESPASMILIENKVKDAQDQPNQIYRYWHHQMHCWKPEHSKDEEIRRSFRLIYLPADESKSPAQHSLERPVDWDDKINLHERVPLKCETHSLLAVMNHWQEKALEQIADTNGRLHVFFQLYKELWIK